MLKHFRAQHHIEHVYKYCTHYSEYYCYKYRHLVYTLKHYYVMCVTTFLTTILYGQHTLNVLHCKYSNVLCLITHICFLKLYVINNNLLITKYSTKYFTKHLKKALTSFKKGFSMHGPILYSVSGQITLHAVHDYFQLHETYANIWLSINTS